MLRLFESPQRRLSDEREVRNYFSKYGDDTLTILRQRSQDRGLSSRDRRHWRRLARTARRMERDDAMPDGKAV